MKNAEGKEHIDCQVGAKGGRWQLGRAGRQRQAWATGDRDGCASRQTSRGADLWFPSPASALQLPPPAPCTSRVLPQGDFLDQAAELIVKQWKEVKKSDVFYIDSKKKVPYWPEAAEEEAA